MDEQSATRALLMLAIRAENREQRIKQSLKTTTTPPFSHEETEAGKDYPTIDRLDKIDDDNTLRRMIKFSLNKLNFLFWVVKPTMRSAFSTRGRKKMDTEHDLFLMLLCFQNNGGTWHYSAAMFRKKFNIWEVNIERSAFSPWRSSCETYRRPFL